jgi:hypothetical protein
MTYASGVVCAGVDFGSNNADLRSAAIDMLGADPWSSWLRGRVLSDSLPFAVFGVNGLLSDCGLATPQARAAFELR